MSEPQAERQPESLPAIRNPYQLATPDSGPTFWTSIDLSNQAGRALAARARMRADKKGEEMVNTTFRVQHVLIHPAMINDSESGEQMECVRSVIVLTDGTVVGFVSSGIFQSLQILSQVYGPPPWTAGLEVQLQSVQTRLGRRMYQLVPIDFVSAKSGSKSSK